MNRAVMIHCSGEHEWWCLRSMLESSLCSIISVMSLTDWAKAQDRKDVASALQSEIKSMASRGQYWWFWCHVLSHYLPSSTGRLGYSLQIHCRILTSWLYVSVRITRSSPSACRSNQNHQSWNRRRTWISTIFMVYIAQICQTTSPCTAILLRRSILTVNKFVIP